jgi:MFS family permease
MTPAERRMTTLVALLACLDLVLWFTAVPLVPVWERELGLTHVQSGIVLGAYGLAVLLLSIPVGHLADRIGPRPVTIAATILFAVVAPLFAFADTFWQLVALRLSAGLFSAVGWTAGLAWLVGSVAPERHGRALSTVNASASLSTVFGPLLGGPVVAAFGIKATFLSLGAVIAAVAVWAVLEPSRGTAPAGEGHSAIAGIRASLRVRGVRRPVLSILWTAATFGVIQLLAPIRFADLGLSEAAIGWTFTVGAVVSVVVAFSLRPRLDFIDKARIAGLGALLVSACAAAFAFEPPLRGYQAAMVFATGACTLLWVTMYPLCSESAREAGIGQGIALGTMNTAWAFGAIVAPITAGFIAEHWDASVAYGIVAVAGLVTARMLGLSRRPVPA